MKNFFNGEVLLNERRFWLLTVSVCIIGILLRLPTLGSRSLWLDEAYSAWFAALPLRDLWTVVPLYEAHPPMYYTLLKGWSTLFGSTEPALRSLSMVASIANILVLALSGKILRTAPIGNRAAIIAALFLAINSSNIDFAQQARPYSLETLFATLSILFSLLLLRQFTRHEDTAIRLSAALPTVLGLGLCAGLTLWLHNTAIFILLGIWFGMTLALLLCVRGNLARKLFAVTLAGLIALLVWSPFLPMLWRQSHNVSAMAYWVHFQRADILSAWYQAAGGKLPFIPVFLLSMAGLVTLWRAVRSTALLSLVILTLPLGIVLAYSYFIQAIYISRLFAWLAPCVMACAAMGVFMGIRRPAWRVCATATIAIVCMAATLQSYARQTEDWRGLLADLASNAQTGDIAIIIPNELNVAIDYYRRPGLAFPEWHYVPAPFPARGAQYRYISNLGAPIMQFKDQATIRAALLHHRRVWLISRKAAMYDPEGLVRMQITASRSLVRSYGRNGIVLDLYN